MSRLKRRSFLNLCATGTAAGMACTAAPATAEAFFGNKFWPIRRRGQKTIYPQSVASGSPRPHNVVLWSRVIDPDLPGQDLEVVVQWSTCFFFTPFKTKHRYLNALAANDNCVKVKLDGLKPNKRYYYRFLYRAPGSRKWITSKTGRTKTAPLPHEDVTARFAFFSCQDYIGRFYNSYAHLLLTYPLSGNDLDFTVHLGDYIYETTGDPTFQTPGQERAFSFDDEAGAIQLGSPENPFFAAQSLSNYQQLYKVYRSVRKLQRVHEL
jgi:alkaline phosphatase D